MEGPQVPEISTSNKSSKIDLYVVRAQKSATFDPPKSSISKSSSKTNFQSFQNLRFSLVLGYSPNRRWGPLRRNFCCSVFQNVCMKHLRRKIGPKNDFLMIFRTLLRRRFSKKLVLFQFSSKISPFPNFYANLSKGPQVSEISPGNKSSKIDLYVVREQKSATFDPKILDLKIRIGKF